MLFQSVSNGNAFNWTPAIALSNTTVLRPMASPVVNTKYYLTATKGICAGKDSITVTVRTAPVVTAKADTTICFGNNAVLHATGGVSYLWSPATYLNDPGLQHPTIVKPTETITYHVSAVDHNGCRSIQSPSVTITVTPPPQLYIGADTSVLINQPLQLYAQDVSNSGFIQYNWAPAQGLNDPSIQSPIATIDKDITYTVTAVTATGCEGKAEIQVKVFSAADIYVPNAFSPNGDGKNDVLKAIPVGLKEFKNFAVYNRWGQRVFYTTNPGIGWNGIVGGAKQDSSGYVWTAEGINFNGNTIIRKGTVLLLK